MTTTTAAYTKTQRPLRTKPIKHTITYSVPPAPSEIKEAENLEWFMANVRPVLLALHKLSAADLQLLAERRRWFERIVKAMDDPDLADVPTAPISDEQDARNSRPEPY